MAEKHADDEYELICAACGKPAEGHFAIHRDGFGEGPEVPLCDACGRENGPSCEALWEAIAARWKVTP